MGGRDLRASVFNVSLAPPPNTLPAQRPHPDATWPAPTVRPPLPHKILTPPSQTLKPSTQHTGLSLIMRWCPLQLCFGAVGPGRAAVAVAAARGGRQPAWRGALCNVLGVDMCGLIMIRMCHGRSDHPWMVSNICEAAWTVCFDDDHNFRTVTSCTTNGRSLAPRDPARLPYLHSSPYLPLPLPPTFPLLHRSSPLTPPLTLEGGIITMGMPRSSSMSRRRLISPNPPISCASFSASRTCGT